MTNIVFVGDIVEENGKTVKQNNREIKHEIPLGTLVEITYESEYDEPEEKVKGLRLFVVNHSRDCDGTPLYDLSFKLNAQKEFDEYKQKIDSKSFEDSMEETLVRMLYWQAQGALLRHYDVGCFKVVE